MKYDILLFDADDTVLDFGAAEERALQVAFTANNLHFDKRVLGTYRKNNVREWQRLERGEITVDQVLANRFTDTFRELGITADLNAVSELYETELHFGYEVIPHAEEVLAKLQKMSRLYVASNGVLSIQNSRLSGSGLDKYFIKRFISEEIGVPKPNAEFFRRSFAQIENFDSSRTLIIGDSLSSDIRGGKNAGIATCWFNPSGAQNDTDVKPDYEISDLRQLFDIV